MTAAAPKLLLLAALLLAPAGGGRAADLVLPDFNLPSTGLSAVSGYRGPCVPPVPAPTDTGHYARYGVGAARVESSVTVVVRDGAGRADIVFPRAPGDELSAGYRSALFIKIEGEKVPVLSWATVFCSGSRYLGYKGAALELPREPGAEFLIRDETLALGPLKVRLLRTHPWLAGVPHLDGLCAPGLPKKLRNYSVKTLPAEADGLAFSYDRAKNALRVTWK